MIWFPLPGCMRCHQLISLLTLAHLDLVWVLWSQEVLESIGPHDVQTFLTYESLKAFSCWVEHCICVRSLSIAFVLFLSSPTCTLGQGFLLCWY